MRGAAAFARICHVRCSTNVITLAKFTAIQKGSLTFWHKFSEIMSCLNLKVTYSIVWTTFCKNYRWAQLSWVCSILLKSKIRLIGVLSLIHVFLVKNNVISNSQRIIHNAVFLRNTWVWDFLVLLFFHVGCFALKWHASNQFYFCLTRLCSWYAKTSTVRNLIHEYMSKKITAERIL